MRRVYKCVVRRPGHRGERAFHYRDAGAAVDGDPLDRASGEIGDPLSVVRKDRRFSALRSGERLRSVLVQPAREQLVFVTNPVREDNTSAVRRDLRERLPLVADVHDLRTRRRRNGESELTTRCGSSARREHRQPDGGREENDRPADLEREPSVGRPCSSWWRYRSDGFSGRFVELLTRIGNVMKTPLRILSQAPRQQSANTDRRGRRKHTPIRIAQNNGRERVGHVVAGKCASAGEHLVDDTAEGPDVGAPIDVATLRLLGRHVSGRAENEAGLRHRRRDHRRRHRRGSRAAGARPAPSGSMALARPKSSTLTVPSGRIFDVGWLQITVHDAAVVRDFEGVGDLRGNLRWSRRVAAARG